MSADLLAALGALADEMDRAGGGIYTADFKAGFRHAMSTIAAHQPAEPERCNAEDRDHPDWNATWIPCQLDAGHDGDHYATSGCAGGARQWTAHQSERTDTAEACSCGAPDTTSLNPAEVVVHRTDGPCYITGAQPSEPERGES